MRILHRYVATSFLVIFGLTLFLLTFVMSVGAMIKAIDLVARGVSFWSIVQVFFFNIPYLLMFTIPMSALTAVLLLFGRLSMENEITAMRASGVSLWQIISPVVIITILLSLACVYINSFLGPESHYIRRKALVEVGVDDPIKLLDEGRFIRDFPGMMIYVGKKKGREVEDVVVYELGPSGVKLNVRAARGELREGDEEKVVWIDLYDVRIDRPAEESPLDPSKSRYISAQHYPVKLDFREILGSGRVNKSLSDMTLPELIGAIRNIGEVYPHLSREERLRERMAIVLEANERLALSISCFALCLVGIPLGMKSKRKESSVGIAISLGLVFLFYFFMILAKSLVERPELRPDLIVWFPVIASEIIGFILIKRMN